jgi:hypothetical protein
VKAVDRSLSIFLNAARRESALETNSQEAGSPKELLKIGALAKAARVMVPTIRFWIQEGLLEVAEVRESGYQMFSSDKIPRCEQIRKFKGERQTLNEIRGKLVQNGG